ncbi:GntR family transcriptional regulator [Streptomyces netropsis]|uniref:GntR family transcriptional regulator n=1 Tax=Streptomyces netropsis TaxID=55404 RepID=A0A7W7PH79_STRNE|nr:GntR family transcriptional regulator [Streptomyces netropsis]MBB4890766.1 GntR family transcriptional regulator [Streptomyces netropsis]GGR51869.1 GntR family transcriptional regulator [Streptomyces netropsis]
MSDQPPYLAVAERLRQCIASGEWSPGDRLPSRAQLAEKYEVGDNVVRRAQELLIVQGLLEGRAGSGTYVAEPCERLRMVRSWWREQGGGSPFRADMAGLGKRGTWEHRTEAKVPAPPEIAARLGIAEGDPCVRTEYEFLADGRPVQMSTSWEPYSLTGGTIVVLPEGGPYAGLGVVERMAAIDVVITHAVEQPEPRLVTAAEANVLGVQKSAFVTHIRRTYFCDDGRPVETADIIVPAAHGEIVYEIPIDRP